MNELLERVNRGRALPDVALDACTVVGNCLLITRKCWEATGTFDHGWGVGYGEETDYQFRAMRLGFRGVVLVNTYVYHHGSASFRYQTGFEELQKRNLALFHSKWGSDFLEYQERCSKRDPIRTITARLEQHSKEPIRADVLFILAGISQTIGGVHVVIEICNYLLRYGINAKCLVLGELDQSTLQRFTEPIFFGLLHFEKEATFLVDSSIDVKVVVATLFTTAPPAYLFARMRGIPLVSFVQGYEFLFENGSQRDRVDQSYWLPDWVLTTSSWLETGVRLRTPDKAVDVLPIGIDRYTFLPSAEASDRGKVRVGVFLRREADKGQAILLEMLDRLLPYRGEISATVFLAEELVLRRWLQVSDTNLVRTPVDKGTIARHLRRCDLLVDASLHEGFGLIPLEAMACGATVVASDSGGVTQFLKDRHNGVLIKEVNKAERFAAEVVRLVHDRRLLTSLRREALNTAREYSTSIRYQRYVDYFGRRLEDACHWKSETPTVNWVAGDEGISAVQDVLPSSAHSYLLKPKRRRASLTIPAYVLGKGTIPVLKIVIFSCERQTVTVPGRVRRGLQQYLGSAADAVSSPGRNAWSSIPQVLRGLPFSILGEQSLEFDLEKGWNELLIELPQNAAAEPMRLIFGGKTDLVLSSLQIRAVSPSDEHDSLQERFDASGTVAWTSETAPSAGLLAEGMDLTRYPPGRLRAFGHSPSLLLPEVQWPSDGTVIGWIEF